MEDWVDRGRPDRKGLAVDTTLHRPDTAVPGEEFQNLLHREAKVSEATYADSSVKKGFEAEVEVGGKVGVSAGSEQTSSRLVEASHLDAPGPDGVRRSVPDPDQVN